MSVGSYFLGIKRNWKEGLKHFLACFGAIWLGINFTSFIFESVRNYFSGNYWVFFAVLVFSIIYAAYRTRIVERVKFSINKKDNTNIEIFSGDLFDEGSHLVVPVAEFFDSTFSGGIVSPSSVHGQFIQKRYNGDSKKFENDVDESLKGYEFITKERTNCDRCKSYPIGTTAVVKDGPRKAFLFVLAETDTETSKASSDVAKMWQGLEGLWKEVRNHSNDTPINIPIVGTALSGVGIGVIDSLRLILLSILIASGEKRITSTIRIVVYEKDLDKVNLSTIKEEWS